MPTEDEMLMGMSVEGQEEEENVLTEIIPSVKEAPKRAYPTKNITEMNDDELRQYIGDAEKEIEGIGSDKPVIAEQPMKTIETDVMSAGDVLRNVVGDNLLSSFTKMKNIESPNSLNDTSPTGAQGAYQFTGTTGAAYGLKIDKRIRGLLRDVAKGTISPKEYKTKYDALIAEDAVDERRDFNKSTKAVKRLWDANSKALGTEEPHLLYAAHNQGVKGVKRIMDASAGNYVFTGADRLALVRNPFGLNRSFIEEADSKSVAQAWKKAVHKKWDGTSDDSSMWGDTSGQTLDQPSETDVGDGLTPFSYKSDVPFGVNPVTGLPYGKSDFRFFETDKDLKRYNEQEKEGVVNATWKALKRGGAGVVKILPDLVRMTGVDESQGIDWVKMSDGLEEFIDIHAIDDDDTQAFNEKGWSELFKNPKLAAQMTIEQIPNFVAMAFGAGLMAKGGQVLLGADKMHKIMVLGKSLDALSRTVGGAGIAGLMEGTSAYDEAVEAGYSQGDARKVGWSVTAAGTTLNLLVSDNLFGGGTIAKKFGLSEVADKATTNMLLKFGRKFAVGGLFEAAEEVPLVWVKHGTMEAFDSKEIYSRSKDDLINESAVAGILGFASGGFFDAVTSFASDSKNADVKVNDTEGDLETALISSSEIVSGISSGEINIPSDMKEYSKKVTQSIIDNEQVEPSRIELTKDLMANELYTQDIISEDGFVDTDKMADVFMRASFQSGVTDPSMMQKGAFYNSLSEQQKKISDYMIKNDIKTDSYMIKKAAEQFKLETDNRLKDLGVKAAAIKTVGGKVTKEQRAETGRLSELNRRISLGLRSKNFANIVTEGISDVIAATGRKDLSDSQLNNASRKITNAMLELSTINVMKDAIDNGSIKVINDLDLKSLVESGEKVLSDMGVKKLPGLEGKSVVSDIMIMDLAKKMNLELDIQLDVQTRIDSMIKTMASKKILSESIHDLHRANDRVAVNKAMDMYETLDSKIPSSILNPNHKKDLSSIDKLSQPKLEKMKVELEEEIEMGESMMAMGVSGDHVDTQVENAKAKLDQVNKRMEAEVKPVEPKPVKPEKKVVVDEISKKVTDVQKPTPVKKKEKKPTKKVTKEGVARKPGRVADAVVKKDIEVQKPKAEKRVEVPTTDIDTDLRQDVSTPLGTKGERIKYTGPLTVEGIDTFVKEKGISKTRAKKAKLVLRDKISLSTDYKSEQTEGYIEIDKNKKIDWLMKKGTPEAKQHIKQLNEMTGPVYERGGGVNYARSREKKGVKVKRESIVGEILKNAYDAFGGKPLTESMLKSIDPEGKLKKSYLEKTEDGLYELNDAARRDLGLVDVKAAVSLDVAGEKGEGLHETIGEEAVSEEVSEVRATNLELADKVRDTIAELSIDTETYSDELETMNELGEALSDHEMDTEVVLSADEKRILEEHAPDERISMNLGTAIGIAINEPKGTVARLIRQKITDKTLLAQFDKAMKNELSKSELKKFSQDISNVNESILFSIAADRKGDIPGSLGVLTDKAISNAKKQFGDAIEVVTEDLGMNIWGMIDTEGDKYRITLNKGIKDGDGIVTLAHELGHAFLPTLEKTDPKLYKELLDVYLKDDSDMKKMLRVKYGDLENGLEFSEWVAHLLEKGIFTPDGTIDRKWIKANKESLPVRVFNKLKRLIYKFLGQFSFFKDLNQDYKRMVSDQVVISMMSTGINPENGLPASQLFKKDTEGKVTDLRGSATGYSLNQVSEVAATELKKRPGFFKANKEGVFTGTRNKSILGVIKNSATRFLEKQLNVEYLLDMAGVDKDGMLRKFFVTDIHEGHGKMEAFKFQMNDFIKKRITDSGIDVDTMSRNPPLFTFKPELSKNIFKVGKRRMSDMDVQIMSDGGEFIDGKMSVSPLERVALKLHSMNADNKRHITEGGFKIEEDGPQFRMTEKQLDNIKLESDEQVIFDAVSDWFGGVQKDAVSGAFKQMNGTELDMVDNYFPIRVLSGEVQGVQAKEHYNDELSLSALNDSFMSASKKPGLTKTRTKAKNPIMLDDALGAIIKSNNDASRYIGLAEPVYNARQVARKLKSFMDLTGNNGLYKEIDEMVRFEEGGIKKSSNEKFASKMIGRLTVATLGFKIFTALKQPFSLAPAATEFKGNFLVNTVKMFGSVGINVIKDINQARTGEIDSTISEIEQHSPWFRRRFEGIVSRDIGEVMMDAEKRTRFSDGRLTLSQSSMKIITMMDRAAITSIWNQSKADAKLEGLKEGSAEYWNYVQNKAETVTRRTQPTYDSKDRASITRGLYLKPFTMFFSQASKNFMIISKSIRDIIVNIKAGNHEEALKAAERLAATTLIQAGGLLMMAELKDELFKGDEHEFGETIGDYKQWAAMMSSNVVGLRSITNYIVSGYPSEDPLSRVLNGVSESAGAMLNIGEKGWDEKKGRALMKTLGELTGQPVTGAEELLIKIPKALTEMEVFGE